MSDLVAQAAEFARRAHESIDQRRKYTSEPYIVHPASVAAIVASVTDDPTMLAAAWLHDVVEDTPVAIDEIAAQFGDDVARLVADLTKVSRPEDGNRAARKAIDRSHTAQADPRAKTIKLADVIDNLTGLADFDANFARTYVVEKKLLLDELREGDPELFARAAALIDELEAQLIDRT